MLRTLTEFALCMHLLGFQVPSDEMVARARKRGEEEERKREKRKRGGERKEARLQMSQ